MYFQKLYSGSQSDHMGRLIVQYLAIYNNLNLHKSIKFCQSRLKFLPDTKQTLR